MALTQENRLIAIETPLGKDAFLLQGLKGREAISTLFSYSAELLSEDPEVAFDQVIGQPVAIAMQLADGSDRHLHGYVSRFVQGDRDERFTTYRAEIVPWLWFLTRRSDCRIFQEKTVPEIVKQVFTELGFQDFSDRLEGSFAKREYCVQYRETDFNFVSRLMEEEGIFYFFEHAEEKHTLVLASGAGAHKPCPGQPKARCAFGTGALESEDVVRACGIEQTLHPGKVSLTDYNFKAPGSRMLSVAKSAVEVGGNNSYEVFDYPGLYDKKALGDKAAERWMEAEEAAHWILDGESTCRAFTPGARFSLEEHYRPDLNQPYVLVEVAMQASVGEAYVSGAAGDVGEYYTNRFFCIPHERPFRPTRSTRKPVVDGPQTAFVVGKSGEEIWTDEHGRVKVLFHWDRKGKADENSSCWVRVSQGWAGKKWGMIFLPRIGQEVIVDFLEGDPDRPIITGSVYNAEQTPPYELPGEATKSTIKSSTSKGGKGFNEIRFEDKKGEEQLFLHAEKDQESRVKEKSLEWVGKSRHLIVGADQLEKVGGDKHLTIKGNHNEKSDGTISIEAGMDRQRKVGMNYALDSAMEVHLKAGMNLVTEAGTSLTLKVGGSTISLTPAGAFLNGPVIMLNSGGAAGSGAGSQPEAPKLPAATEKGDPGDTGKGKPDSAERSGGVSPQAVALRRAAQQGAPFCEACEAARRELLRRQQEEAEAPEAGPSAVEEEPEWERPAEEKVHWFEVELVDEEGKGVADIRYRIELPDGTVIEDRLDGQGRARVEDLDNPGMGKVRFLKDQEGEAVEAADVTADLPAAASTAAAATATAGAAPQAGSGADEEQTYEVIIRLDVNPSDASTHDDRFILSSSDGSYRSEKTVKDDHVPGDEYLDLQYTGLSRDKSYTLQVQSGSETSAVFENVPYDSLAGTSANATPDEEDGEGEIPSPGEDDPYPDESDDEDGTG